MTNINSRTYYKTHLVGKILRNPPKKSHPRFPEWGILFSEKGTPFHVFQAEIQRSTMASLMICPRTNDVPGIVQKYSFGPATCDGHTDTDCMS